jgi:RNA polymerase sigma factor (sigma-70 family)
VAEDLSDVYADELAPVWRYVRSRVPGHTDAEDLTSEVFARAARGWGRYDPRRGSVRAWLLGIAHHVVTDWWRRHDREVPSDQIELAAGSAQSAEEVALRRAEVEELRSHLGRLTDKERDALALRFGGGLKAAEAGEVLGVSEAALRMLVYRAVSKLREVMVVD